MNYYELFESLDIDTSKLDHKKNHTSYKIRYVSSYVKQWLYVVANISSIKRINFIDCMCNAGIYKDGDLTTALEVLLIFFNHAIRHEDKEFHLFLNDLSSQRIQICQTLVNAISIANNRPSNVLVHYDTQDVNTYLSDTSSFDKFLLGSVSTIFFVDPYDLGTVRIKNLANISHRYYCEIIFNVFTSDLVRNKLDDRIKRCLGTDDITDKTDLLDYIASKLKVGKINYSFNYEFRISTNTEIYSIIFATPNMKGLEKIKVAIWETFEGREFFRTQTSKDDQLSLFDREIEVESQRDYHACAAKRRITKEFHGKVVDYADIESFALEKTMLKASDLLSTVIKPLISSGIILKLGKASKINYKQDSYKFIEEFE